MVELHKLNNYMELHINFKASNVLNVPESTSERWIFDLLTRIWFDYDVPDLKLFMRAPEKF